MNIPEGWPTEEMQLAGAQAINIDTTPVNKLWTANKVFKAMYAAAPTPSAQEDEPYCYLYENDEDCPVFSYVKSEWNAGKDTEVPLYTRPDNLRKAAEELIHTYDFACKEDACYASNDHVEALRAALEGK